MIYLELFIGFLKVGLFAFGGAYGAIPLIRDVVLSYGWIDDEMLTYMIAVSESTPGPIMINLATYVGSSRGGLAGAALATLAVIIPSFVIILLVVGMFSHLLKNRWVQAALGGMKPCVVGIIMAVGSYMMLSACFGTAAGPGVDLRNLAMTCLLLAVFYGFRAVRRKKLSPVLLILVSACAGIVIF